MLAKIKRSIPESLPIADVFDNEHPCSYLPNRTASLPLIFPNRRVSPDEFDHLLDSGMRRSGVFLYYNDCAACSACEPSRVDVARYQRSKSMERIFRRGNECLTLKIQIPQCDPQRLELFNRHRNQRHLGDSDGTYSPTDYQNFLVDTCCEETIELSFRIGEQLVGVSIIDVGRRSLSAVYTYFDPSYSKYSLGSYSILKQFEFAKSTHRQYVYLGMYVRENSHLNYKGRFTPQERYIGGRWQTFESHIS